MTDEELIEYFNEHILYELLMLRYARTRLASETQILWNAMFSAFNVSARNLYEFFNSKGGRNEVGLHDYRRHCGGFRRSDISDITGTLILLNEQCFHMGKKRPKALHNKVELDRIEAVFDWVQGNMTKLIESFDDNFRARICVDCADPYRQTEFLVFGPTGSAAPPSATNNVSGVSNEP